MITNWFDIIYLTFIKNGEDVDNDKYNEICTEDDELNAFDDAKKKADHFYEFINKQQLSTATTALFTQDWAMNVKYSEDNNDYINNAWDVLRNLSFDDEHTAQYNEMLARIIKTKGRYADKTYHLTDKDNQENEDADVIPSAESIIEQFNVLKTQKPSMRNILHIYYNTDYISKLSDIKLSSVRLMPPYAYIETVVRVLTTIADINRIITDESSKIFEAIASDYDNDEELLKAIAAVKDIKLGEDTLTTVFDAKKIYDLLNYITTNFKANDHLLKDKLNELLESKDLGEIGRSDIYREAYETRGSLIDAATTADIDYTKQADKIKQDAFVIVSKILEELKEYIDDIYNNVSIFYSNLVTNHVHPNNADYTMGDCLSKWKGFLNSELYKSPNYGKNLIDDVKGNITPAIYDKLDDQYKELLNRDVALNAVEIIRDVDFDKKTGIPEGLFIQKDVVPDYQTQAKQWAALTAYLLSFFGNNYSEKTIEMAKAVKKFWYDAACVMIYALTSPNAKRITVSGGRRVAESYYNRYDDIMLFEKTVIMKQFADMTQVFNRVYQNFKDIIDNKVTFKDFVKDVLNSFKEVKQDEQKPVADANVAQEVNKNRELTGEVKQAVASVANS